MKVCEGREGGRGGHEGARGEGPHGQVRVYGRGGGGKGKMTMIDALAKPCPGETLAAPTEPWPNHTCLGAGQTTRYPH